MYCTALLWLSQLISPAIFLHGSAELRLSYKHEKWPTVQSTGGYWSANGGAINQRDCPGIILFHVPTQQDRYVKV